jgi:hypothetical protein
MKKLIQALFFCFRRSRRDHNRNRKSIVLKKLPAKKVFDWSEIIIELVWNFNNKKYFFYKEHLFNFFLYYSLTFLFIFLQNCFFKRHIFLPSSVTEVLFLLSSLILHCIKFNFVVEKKSEGKTISLNDIFIYNRRNCYYYPKK